MLKAVVVDPSGQPDRAALERNLVGMKLAGFHAEVCGYPPGAGNRLRAAGVLSRLTLLDRALDQYDIILCARGGYGMSDLLDDLDWSRLETNAPRLVVGFSDICALQSALYARLGWCSLHAPMPGSSLWRADGEDVDAVLDVLRAWPGACRGTARLIGACGDAPIRGRLFGGCFSVLGSLIGTANFPASLAGHIVFLEDVNESVPRVLRGWNQWRQSGVLDGVSAVVLGRFTHADRTEAALLDELPAMLRERSPCPVLTSSAFGHVSPNMPLMIGAQAEIAGSDLSWSFDPGPMIA